MRNTDVYVREIQMCMWETYRCERNEKKNKCSEREEESDRTKRENKETERDKKTRDRK